MRSTISPMSSDAELTTRIRIAFATRPRITWHDIQVSVRHGIVTLRGEVPTPYDRHLVVAITQHVAGVFGIDDQLHVPQLPPVKRASTSTTVPVAKHCAYPFLRAGLAAFAVALATLTGCGSGDSRVPVHPATGAIQFRGQPAAGAFISLHPKEGAGSGAPSPRATVGPDGKFAFTTYEGDDGAPEGEYVVTVQWYKPVRQGQDFVGGPNVLPRKYAVASTSDLKIRIAAGENHLQPIQLR